jgi:hypothetical protein
MPRQLNIRSDRAYEAAQRLAAHLNKSTTSVVETALERLAASVLPEVSPEEAAETRKILDEFADAFSARKQPGESSDHSYLYDDRGLPI